jgi:hypothetical protein
MEFVSWDDEIPIYKYYIYMHIYGKSSNSMDPVTTNQPSCCFNILVLSSGLKPVEVGVAIHVVVRCMDIFHLKSVYPAGSTPE